MERKSTRENILNMKLFISDKKLSGGPSVFKNKLIKKLNLIGYSLTHDPNEYADMELGFISFKSEKAKKKILRLDGVYYQKHQISMNKEIAYNIKKADGVICQSSFSKQMIEKMICKLSSRTEIIYNGTDISVASNAIANKRFSNLQFVMCADWRNTKRPISSVNGFYKWVKDNNRHDARLVIIGDFSKYINTIDKDIKKYLVCLGDIKNNDIYSVFKSSDFMIHLCFIDSCPNAVVEGLACDLRVLCTNLGGTMELVRESGVVINCDKFNFKPVEKITDNLSSQIVSNGIRDILRTGKQSNIRPDLDMDVTVDKYIKFMDSIK